VLLVITYNKKFGRMTLAFARAAASVMHISIAILMVVMLYAVASMSLFSTNVIDPATGQPYFDTFSRSLVTMFRMFTGNWHDTMYQAVEATTEGAQLWFTAYVFVLAVFCCELFVGVVIAGYSELQGISSTRMHWVFAPVFEECKHDERESLIEQLLKLAHKMRPCNQLQATILGHIQQSAELEFSRVGSCKIEQAPDSQVVAINLIQAATSSSSDEGATPEDELLPNMVNKLNLKPTQHSQYDELSSKRRSSIVKFKQEQPVAFVSTPSSDLCRPELHSIFTHQISRGNSHSDGQGTPQDPKCAKDNLLLGLSVEMVDNPLHDMVTQQPRAPLQGPLPTPPKAKPKRLQTCEEKQARNEVTRMARDEAAKSRLSEDVLARQ